MLDEIDKVTFKRDLPAKLVYIEKNELNKVISIALITKLREIHYTRGFASFFCKVFWIKDDYYDDGETSWERQYKFLAPQWSCLKR